MDLKTKEAFSEISEIFWLLGDKYTDRLPKNLIEYIESNKNIEYIPTYSRESSIDKLKLKEETKAFLSFLYLSYWCDSPEEKNELLKQLKNNNKQIESKIKINDIHLNELFPNTKNIATPNIQTQEQLTIIKKETIFIKIFNKIKNLFSKNK